MVVQALLITISIQLSVLLALLVVQRQRDLKEAQALIQRNEALEEQVKTQTAIRTENSGLRGLADAAYNALILVDERHRVVHMNEAARSLFGVASADRDVHGHTLMAVTRNHEIVDIVTTRQMQGDEFIQQISLRGLTYRVRTQGIEACDDQPEQVAIALEDISELQRLGRARRDMVANISHELRTPITSISLLVETLRRIPELSNLKENSELDVILRRITAETETLGQLARELLDLSMIESGRAEIILVPIVLRDVVEQAVARFVERARQKSIVIEGQVPPNLKVLADAEQIGRVLNNLLSNALKYTPQNGLVNISVTLDIDMAILEIIDSGPGIHPDDRERIFERFFRVDRSRRSEGTGLGLAIAKHIVMAHGGTIWAEDPPEPPGARICFTLPLV